MYVLSSSYEKYCDEGIKFMNGEISIQEGKSKFSKMQREQEIGKRQGGNKIRK